MEFDNMEVIVDLDESNLSGVMGMEAWLDWV